MRTTRREGRRAGRRELSIAALMLLVGVALALWGGPTPPRRVILAGEGADQLDPAAWGGDHVDVALPEYLEGGECLFCHRHDVGGSWQTDRHSRTVRDAVADDPAMQALTADAGTRAVAPEVQMLLGTGRHVRFVRRGAEYGHADLLSAHASSGRGTRWRISQTGDPAWDAEMFGQRCAGCHATAVATEDRAFASVGLDCFVCHGAADEEHANDSSLMILAKERKDPPRVVVSICAQCHLRGGRSRSTGLPYPNQFVAGDNLFRDFEVDFAQADNAELNPGDRHIWINARDVALFGREETTCLSCHEVHGHSTERHRKLADAAICAACHDPAEPKTKHLIYEVHSDVCGY